ncbi:MAG: nucleotidyltransferase domain-containing protein [Candidatus Kapabacteria bacterium]|nr:nucleotidyltransferase domain-containing protein [Candidatus Kapabacteria bacterium]
MPIKESLKKIIDDFIEECKIRNIFFSKVILFGSYAKGHSNEDSDIDLALVSDQFSGNPFADWHKLSPINIKFSLIESHPFSSKYFEESDPFIEEIKRTGIRII